MCIKLPVMHNYNDYTVSYFKRTFLLLFIISSGFNKLLVWWKNMFWLYFEYRTSSISCWELWRFKSKNCRERYASSKS